VNWARRLRSPWLALAVAVVAIVGVAAFAIYRAIAPAFSYQRVAGTPRTQVRDSAGRVVATLTEGARTVVLAGPERTFAERRTTTATVRGRSWVRLAPRPWHDGDATVEHWLADAVDDRDPDVLAIGMQYLDGAPDRKDGDGLRYAGDARYGPLSDGERAENSDFTDYLGIDWTFPDGQERAPQADHAGALDCSGFVRMVYGYRSGYPLEWGEPTGRALPRRAVMMAGRGPGVVVVPNNGEQPADIDALLPGDLLFFDVDPNDGPAIDHVGIYLGPDSGGRPRFVSSRKLANGPTMGDLGGASLLTGGGYYAKGWRSAKRL
jgi:cell wall-associated NlpC family hydrolase